MASSTQRSIIELPSPFADERGKILLHEEPDVDVDRLLSSVLSGEYGKPFVIDDGETRSLYFSFAYVQSVMKLRQPIHLEVTYTRKMMSFLLFHHQPKSLLMLGLGGGSLVKYCHAHLPLSRMMVVEINTHVIAFRDQFMIPDDDSRLSIRQADAADYLAQCSDVHDVILVDTFDREGFSPSLCNREFYRTVHDSLAGNGIVVVNLVGPKEERRAHLDIIRSVFDDNVLLLPVADEGNYIVVAFRDACFEPRWRWIESQAKAMKSRYGLNFPAFAEKLERSRKLGYLDRL
jgi:spermidine synthase